MRNERIAKQISAYITRGEKILDIGAGSCAIDKILIEKYRAIVTPLDVVDYNRTSLKLTLYDGKKFHSRMVFLTLVC